MVKHTQTIRWQFADELFLSVFDYFIKLALKGLRVCEFESDCSHLYIFFFCSTGAANGRLKNL